MSFNDEYLKLRKKRLEEEQKQQKNASFEFVSGPYQNATLTADDIAPVVSTKTTKTTKSAKTEEKNEGSGLFKAGAFADGYQFGDVTKTILGTAGDVASGLVQGVAGIGEGLGDAISYSIAGVQDLVGKDDDAERLRKEAANSQLGPLFDYFREKTNIDDTSLLGDFGYGVAQALGQVGAVIATGGLGAAAGLSTAGVSALTTGVIGASSMGSGMSEAYQGGATDEEAFAYGAMSGIIDAGTEMIFGGLGKAVNALGVSRGISSLDDVFAKKLSSKISNQFFKNATEFGVKATAEGFEEVLAGLGSATAKKLTYMSDEELSQLVEDENLLEQFVTGALVSGIAQSGDLVKSTKQGRDFITNFSANEETVIEKVYNDRVAEAEQDGTKLTNKEKNKLYEQVQEEMRKGYISTDDIESALGGEAYRSYKNSFDIDEKNKAEIKKEIEKLENLPKDQITVKQHEKLLQLREDLKAIENDTTTQNWKDELDVKISSTIASDNFLKESYYERARRGKAFEADLSKYDDKTAETVKRAIDSGILNNTRRTHEFVDMIAKISADKGVLFDFTNNAKLKESGFAVDGASVNGYVTKDGITININSSKAHNSIVGHEITHVLEGTELYAEMQSAIFEYAKSKKDYDGRRKTLEELYKNLEDADIDAELTADLVGDYLFTDEAFINNLSTKHRNVFQKVYDEIKYLLKVATAGSKEARELEKVKKAFDKAYRESGKTSGDTKYSLSDSDGKQLTKEQSEYFKDSKMRDENGNLKVMYHGSQDAGFHTFDAKMSDDDTSFFFVDRNDVAASYSGTTETYEAQTIRTAEDMNNFLVKIGYDSYKAVEKDGKFELLENNEHVAYSDTAQGLYDEFCWYEGVGEGDANYKVYLNLKNPLEVDAEGRNWNNISREFSQEVYGRYKSLTAEEKAALSNLAEWGEYSIFRDEMLEARATAEQGGSGVFDEAYTKNLARAYEKLGGANANLYDAFSIAQENFSEESLREFAVKQMNTRDYARKAKAEGYDGVIFKNIHDNGGYSNGSEGASTVAIAFESNQIKSVANEKPTGNADIRYSLSTEKTIDKYTQKQYNDFGWARDTEAISKNELDDLYSKIQEKGSLKKFTQTSSGEAIIEVNDDPHATLKVNNVFVFAKGTKNNPEITRVVRVNFYDEASVDVFRKDIYERTDNRSLAAYARVMGEEAIRYYDRSSSADYRAYKDRTRTQQSGIGSEGNTGNYRNGKQRVWNFEETQSNDIAPINKASSTDGVFFDGKNTKYSLSSDSKGRELSAEQREYFKDSKIVDDNGSLKVMHHGSPEQFTVFDKKKAKYSGTYGKGFYFSDSISHASTYGELYDVYLNITNPLQNGTNDITKDQIRKFVEAIAEDEDYGIDNYGYDATIDSVTDSVYGKSDFGMILDLNISCVGDMVEAIELFNKVNGTDYNGIIAPTETVAFYPEQIKIIDNKAPTSNPDIRFSLSEYTAEEKKAHNKAVLEHFGKTYSWAETGYLLLDGTRLDLSGKHDGAPGGYRTVDHRDITEALGYDYGGGDYSGSLVQFMSEGNIRIIPECNGINLSVKPTKEQEQALSSYISRYRGEVLLDIDDLNGNTVVSVEYPYGTYYTTILNDIREWFDNGKKPENSGSYSLTKEGETPKRYGTYNIFGEDIRLESPTNEDIAPVAEAVDKTVDKAVAKNATPTDEGVNNLELQHKIVKQKYMNANKANDTEAVRRYSEELIDLERQIAEAEAATTKKVVGDFAPMPSEPTLYELEKKQAELEDTIRAAMESNDPNAPKLIDEYGELLDTIAKRKVEESAMEGERLASLDDADVPPEMEAPYYGESTDTTPENPFEDRDIKAVGNRKVKAYMYENPEVKPFFQEEANILLGELRAGTKGEKFYTEVEGGVPGAYGSDSYGIWSGTKRHVSADIEYLLDELHYSYAEIEKGLNAIIEDHGAENNAASKRIEFILNDRLLKGYTEFTNGYDIPPNQDYIKLLNEKQIIEYSDEARAKFFEVADEYAPPAEDIAPIAPVAENTTVNEPIIDAPIAEAYEAIKPKKETSSEPRLKRVKEGEPSPSGKERKWIGTSTESEAVDGKILPEDLDQEAIHYQPISNRKTLDTANSKLNGMGYEASVTYFNSQFANKKTTLEDIVLGERLIQEAIKRGDTKTAGELIEDVAILGTELGQKVQALSIIKRLTPEGQLRMLQRTVERGKTRGDKAFEGVEITQEMIDKILATYGKDGSFDQTKLNEAVEDAKQKIADQMKVTKMDKVNAWRYLSMLGNPKTHIRNLVSNVAMRGTTAVKNVVARTIETFAPIENRTKTWKKASDEVKAFAQKTAMEMKEELSDGGKYNEDASIKQKRDIFKNKVLNGVYEFNSDMLSKEDWWFSKPAFTNALSEYLTANGIRTEEDIKNNPKIVAKAKQYATEQSQIATFRQYSWLANKINEIEHKNIATEIAIGAVLPFKKTPINIAKTALNYSPLGFAKTLTYDASQVKNGKMEASELVDHLAQNITGSALVLIGYMLANAGFINGAGEDDKEGDYDYQLGEQAYSVNIGDATFSLSWLSPIAMPLFVGANAYEQLVEGKEWNGDVVVETLAQTLDPLSEMSFLSSLDSVLSSYDSGIEKFAGMAQSAGQSYITQFVPTFSSQVAAVMDDTKRSTKVAADSEFKFVDETVNKLKYKIPFLRETLEPSTDIWGNEVKQTENLMERAFETFIAPYAKKEDISSGVDEELKALYKETGDAGLIPSIPYNYINYDGEKYEMSAGEYTEYKKLYGQNAYELMSDLFKTTTYKNASSEERADMVNRVYDFARDEAKREYFAKYGVEFTNATKDGEEYYKENSIKGAIEYDMTPDEYEFATENPEKYKFLHDVGLTYEEYDNGSEEFKDAYSWAFKNPEKFTVSKAVASDVVTYRNYTSDLYDIKADKDEYGKSISGSRKEKVIEYVNNLDIDYGARLILFKSEYNADDTYNYDIIDYLNAREDISYEEMVTILKELGFTVLSDGTIQWD